MENCAYMKKVIVEINSRQHGIDKKTDVIKSKAAANYYDRSGRAFVIYKEKDDENGTVTSTMLKIAADSVSLTRHGGIKHQQVFAEGQTSVSDYATPYGTMHLKVKTNSLTICSGKVNIFEIKADYDLYVNGRWQSRNELSIIIYPAN